MTINLLHEKLCKKKLLDTPVQRSTHCSMQMACKLTLELDSMTVSFGHSCGKAAGSILKALLIQVCYGDCSSSACIFLSLCL